MAKANFKIFFLCYYSCFYENLYNYSILFKEMKDYKLRLIFFIIFIFLIIITMNMGNAKSQNSTEQSNVYLKLLNLINNTNDDVIQSMRAIESGDDSIALNILTNVTVNLEELSNGLDVLINEPLTQ